MSKLAVVTGATLKCSHGTETSTLLATTEVPVELLGLKVASIRDHQASTNIKPFGNCKIKERKKGHPCPCGTPETPEPWTPGEINVLLPSLGSLLTDKSNIKCKQGGTIEILDPGQRFFTAEKDEAERDEAEKDELSVMDGVVWGTASGKVTGNIGFARKMYAKSVGKNLKDFRLSGRLIEGGGAVLGSAPDIITSKNARDAGEKIAAAAVGVGAEVGCHIAADALTDGAAEAAELVTGPVCGAFGSVASAAARPVIHTAVDAAKGIVHADVDAAKTVVHAGVDGAKWLWDKVR